MAGIARWFKSGGVVSKKFSPLRGRDDGVEDDHEMETEPRSSEKDVDGTLIFTSDTMYNIHIVCINVGR